MIDDTVTTVEETEVEETVVTDPLETALTAATAAGKNGKGKTVKPLEERSLHVAWNIPDAKKANLMRQLLTKAGINSVGDYIHNLVADDLGKKLNNPRIAELIKKL